MGHISDIKLIRTDTTLDLSQKAEKGMLCSAPHFFFYFPASPPPYSFLRDVGFVLETNKYNGSTGALICGRYKDLYAGLFYYFITLVVV